MSSEKKIIVYTTMMCPYCHRAKHLLNKKNVDFEEIDVTFSSEKRANMRKISGGVNTVPQIFIDEYHVGGCDDLYALETEGKLDELLSKS